VKEGDTRVLRVGTLSNRTVPKGRYKVGTRWMFDKAVNRYTHYIRRQCAIKASIMRLLFTFYIHQNKLEYGHLDNGKA